jgi:hypothetical protein
MLLGLQSELSHGLQSELSHGLQPVDRSALPR